MTASAIMIGVDVGGTFTDLFLLDPATRSFKTCKVPSHRGDEARGFLNGLAQLDGLATRGDAGAGGSIVHGTTVGTNTLIERRGPKIGVITTRGFRDVLEMRRRDRRRTWGLWGDFVPIVARDMRIEVGERTLAGGTVRIAVDPDEIRSAQKLLREKGAESIAILFINAYANPDNERGALAALRAVWPNEHISASHEVLAEIREFERFSTTALNAYLQPVVGAYLGKLEAALGQTPTLPSPDGTRVYPSSAVSSGRSRINPTSAGGGIKGGGKLHIVQSNGGIMSTASARKLPVRTALSGPAAGVIAAAAIARAAGFENVITCDLGGTSFDVSVIAAGKPAVAPQTTIDFGLVIRTPMVEITTIGAGGGSLAYVDRGGLLQVGPESAGSIPGPACYGLGNTRPTLTDAQLVLGRINASRPLGGELKSLDIDKAKRAVATHVGEPLGLAIAEAADAIVRVAEARMAGAIRLISIERGHDPKRFVAMPFGGGGALHIGALIRQIGLGCAVVPRFPGITSALGCVIADPKHDMVQTVNLALDGIDAAALQRRLRESGEKTSAVIAATGIPVGRIDVQHELDMHYLGQTHTIAVPLGVTGPGAAPAVTQDSVRAAFETAYDATFGRLLRGLPIAIASLRVSAIGHRPAFDASIFAPDPAASLDRAALGSRQVWFGSRWRDTRIWSRLDLPAGADIEGPAILEQPDATTVIEPGLTGRIDRLGNVIVRPAA